MDFLLSWRLADICPFLTSGPSSVGLDVCFPGFNNVYGIPEHADSLALRSTRLVTEFFRLLYYF